jgi:hypothetical protein
MCVVQGEIGGGLYNGDKGSLRTGRGEDVGLWHSERRSPAPGEPPKQSADQQCGPELALHARPMIGKTVHGYYYLAAPVLNTYGRNILIMSCHRHGAGM